MYRYGSHVAHLDTRTRWHGNAELGQHVIERLHRKGRLAGLVTRAVQAHYQAVSNQLVGAHASNAGNILEPLGLCQRADQQDTKA